MSLLTDYQKAALDYDHHISLTANAGSGKTTVLSKRYVEILLNEKVSINNIVAITFTEKAASELYKKIAKELDDRINQLSGWRKTRLEKLRRGLVSAKISTIHSFCIDILKDFAPEAGIDANFSPIDARLSDELLEQSIDEVISRRLSENDNSAIKYLIRIFSNKTALSNKIKVMFGKRKAVELLINDFENSTTEEIEKSFQKLFEDNFKSLFEKTISQLIKEIIEINNIVGTEKESKYQIEITRLLNELNSKEKLIDKYILLGEIKNQVLTGGGNVRSQGYFSAKLKSGNEDKVLFIEQTFNMLKQIEIDNDYKLLNKELAEFNKILFDFYLSVKSIYEFKKKQKSFLDFEDLLLITQLLLDNEEVREALSEKYKYIMVDEYQDTNEIQYKIFMPILKNLSTGNLFVVGDEKQSIYMFREAEVEVFNKTKNDIENVSSKKSILDLPHSFRLAPQIAFFTNLLFSRLFENPNERFNEVIYNNLVCAYPHNTFGEVEFLIANEEEIFEDELLAKKVKQLTSEGIRDYSDIAILCKKRKHFLELENVLNKYSIPFTIVGGKGFFQQQLVLDIYNYLAFLLNQQNDLALTSILRAPFFNFSDIDLMEMNLLKGKNFYDKLIHYSEKNNKAESALQLLQKHLGLIRQKEIGDLINIIATETGYWFYLTEKQNGKQEIANLKKLIQKSIDLSAQGFFTLYDFLIYLKDAIDNLEDEGQADLDDIENSVKIMTIHQSKGLEFKVVCLYKINHKNFDDTLKSKELAIDKEFGALTKLPMKNNFFEDYKQAPIVGIYNFIQNRKSIAELKRLFYVAVTRAEEHLIISMSYKDEKEKLWDNSFAEMLKEALDFSFSDEEISFDGNLKMMKLENEKYVTHDEKMNLKIKLIKDVEVKIDKEGTLENENLELLKFYNEEIISHEKNEIISASKISLFLQCPRKYQLTYEFGYGQLIKTFEEDYEVELNEKEDEEVVAGNVFGSITHAILEKDLKDNLLKITLEDLIDKNEDTLLYNENTKTKLLKELLELINSYYNSTSYKEISSYKNYSNEVEIYKRENDYYLYGIIDRLIIAEDKIIIVDYKSDKISKRTIEEKKEIYFNQLSFYAYILKNEYPQINEFQLNLIFLRDDSFSSTKILNRKDLEEFGSVIKNSVLKIRRKEFDENAKGCKNMKFYYLPECKN